MFFTVTVPSGPSQIRARLFWNLAEVTADQFWSRLQEAVVQTLASENMVISKEHVRFVTEAGYDITNGCSLKEEVLVTQEHNKSTMNMLATWKRETALPASSSATLTSEEISNVD